MKKTAHPGKDTRGIRLASARGARDVQASAGFVGGFRRRDRVVRIPKSRGFDKALGNLRVLATKIGHLNKSIFYFACLALTPAGRLCSFDTKTFARSSLPCVCCASRAQTLTPSWCARLIFFFLCYINFPLDGHLSETYLLFATRGSSPSHPTALCHYRFLLDTCNPEQKKKKNRLQRTWTLGTKIPLQGIVRRELTRRVKDCVCVGGGRESESQRAKSKASEEGAE